MLKVSPQRYTPRRFKMVLGPTEPLNELKTSFFPTNLSNVYIKCYKNTEKKTGYLDNDPMGGDESYSASKGSAELLINSYIFLKFCLQI